MKIGFIGAGNMGGALARAVSLSGAEVFIYDKDEKKSEDLARAIGAECSAPYEMVAKCDAVFLGVKPNIIPAVAEEIAEAVSKRDGACLIISMAAGVKTSDLASRLGVSTPIIRIMPNTPVAYGAGMVLWSKSSAVTEDMERDFLSFMDKAGRLDLVPEELIDAGTAISGCGPAFAYMFIDALTKGGVAAGLSEDKAKLYACEMLKGAAITAMNSEKPAAVLREEVCSPGGSTIEGVKVLWDGGFEKTVSDAVEASFNKTVLLGKK